MSKCKKFRCTHHARGKLADRVDPNSWMAVSLAPVELACAMIAWRREGVDEDRWSGMNRNQGKGRKGQRKGGEDFEGARRSIATTCF